MEPTSAAASGLLSGSSSPTANAPDPGQQPRTRPADAESIGSEITTVLSSGIVSRGSQSSSSSNAARDAGHRQGTGAVVVEPGPSAVRDPGGVPAGLPRAPTTLRESYPASFYLGEFSQLSANDKVTTVSGTSSKAKYSFHRLKDSALPETKGLAEFVTTTIDDTNCAFSTPALYRPEEEDPDDFVVVAFNYDADGGHHSALVLGDGKDGKTVSKRKLSEMVRTGGSAMAWRGRDGLSGEERDALMAYADGLDDLAAARPDAGDGDGNRGGGRRRGTRVRTTSKTYSPPMTLSFSSSYASSPKLRKASSVSSLAPAKRKKAPRRGKPGVKRRAGKGPSRSQARASPAEPGPIQPPTSKAALPSHPSQTATPSAATYGTVQVGQPPPLDLRAQNFCSQCRAILIFHPTFAHGETRVECYNCRYQNVF